LKYHARVLYIDIDIHHGDGVEEAFYLTDRVMTVSFHKFGDLFFPGTGDLGDVGMNNGKYYSVNVPLHDGMDDQNFVDIFKSTMQKVMEVFQPGAIILQCGADSLAADRLGCFNLTLQGHASCVAFMKSFNIPLLVLGGGGYIKSNVARCWANETATLLGKTLDENIPEHEFYYEYYSDASYQLKVQQKNPIENLNSYAYLQGIKTCILDNLSQLEVAPSVQMHEVPPEAFIPELDESALTEDESSNSVIKSMAVNALGSYG